MEGQGFITLQQIEQVADLILVMVPCSLVMIFFLATRPRGSKGKTGNENTWDCSRVADCFLKAIVPGMLMKRLPVDVVQVMASDSKWLQMDVFYLDLASVVKRLP